MTDREVLEQLVKQCRRLHLTPVVDRDFTSVKCDYDRAFLIANTHITANPLPVAPTIPGSVLQDWVFKLGLRHQGVLLTAVRGPDTSPKEDAAKALVRVYRSYILNCHCGDPAKAKSFIEAVDAKELWARMNDFTKSFDHYPIHYVMHLIHASEIVAYKHPDPAANAAWAVFYSTMCRKLHLNPETVDQLDQRLNADEITFAKAD